MSPNNIDITKELKDFAEAAKQGKAIFWIGAGLSNIAGCQKWSDIVSGMCSELAIIEENFFSSDKLTYPKKLFVLKNKYKEKNNLQGFYHRLFLVTNFDENLHAKDYAPIIQKIKNIMPPVVIITTNIDGCIEKTGLQLEEQNFSIKEEFKEEHIRPGALFHLHGTEMHIKGSVWECEEYEDFYKNPNVVNFLSVLVKNYSILFICSGLKEPEILTFFNETTATKHYALMSQEDEFKKGDMDFYEAKHKIKIIEYGPQKKFSEIFKTWIDQSFPLPEPVVLKRVQDDKNISYPLPAGGK